MLALPRTGQPEYEAMIISYCFSGRCDRRRRLLNGLCSRRWSAFRRAQRTCAGPEQRFAPGISRCPGSTPSFALPARLLLAQARPSLSRDEEWEALLQSKGENAEAQMSRQPLWSVCSGTEAVCVCSSTASDNALSTEALRSSRTFMDFVRATPRSGPVSGSPGKRG